jgi:hypothetical protein
MTDDGTATRLFRSCEWVVSHGGTRTSKSSHVSIPSGASDVPSMNTVNAFLDKYGRFGLDAATAASTVGFAAAKATTKLGVRQLPIVSCVVPAHLRAVCSSALPAV